MIYLDCVKNIEIYEEDKDNFKLPLFFTLKNSVDEIQSKYDGIVNFLMLHGSDDLIKAITPVDNLAKNATDINGGAYIIDFEYAKPNRAKIVTNTTSYEDIIKIKEFFDNLTILY
jgi:hypothetical protein